VRVKICPCMAKKKATFPKNNHLNSGIDNTEAVLSLGMESPEVGFGSGAGVVIIVIHVLRET
jgi:hypothetical protein